MKMLNATLVITLMLISHAVFAEQGPTKANSVIYDDAVTMHQDRETREFSPSELTDRNP